MRITWIGEFVFAVLYQSNHRSGSKHNFPDHEYNVWQKGLSLSFVLELLT